MVFGVTIGVPCGRGWESPGNRPLKRYEENEIITLYFVGVKIFRYNYISMPHNDIKIEMNEYHNIIKYGRMTL
jgi:hypothetical protein